ncbi:MAG: HAMP domain-containing protein [Nitriliruptorales bacterium]|nr:HAMP domain-containing protein [Nitriliruptorales bacterium]
MDRWFEAAYRRAPERHLARARASVLVLLAVLVGILVAVALPYVNPTRTEWIRTFVAAEALAIIGGLFVLNPAWKGLHHDVEVWLAGDRSHEATLRAWRRAKGMTFEGVKIAYIRFGPFAFVGGLVYALVEFDLSRSDAVAVFIGLVAAGVLATTAGWPLVEAYLRPLRRDLAQHVGATDATATVVVSLPRRVAAFMAVMSLLTGIVALLVSTFGTRSLDGVVGPLVAVVVVGLAVGWLFGTILTRSLLAPLEDLVQATKQVASGDLGARALVMGDDEIGTLGSEFNKMLGVLDAAAAEVRASRARIVAASDAERRRVERNIHDGAQQQLTALALHLELLRRDLADPAAVSAGLEAAIERLRESLEQLRELAQGLHPSILTTDGLAPALQQLAARSPVPVRIRASTERFEEAAEATAWFVASEALANMAKYAHATEATVELVRSDGHVILEVSDDGVGGASPEAGSGLAGLVDRVEAVGGRLVVDSPAGRGTTIRAELPTSLELR